jgi:hypothetical protein
MINKISAALVQLEGFYATLNVKVEAEKITLPPGTDMNQVRDGIDALDEVRRRLRSGRLVEVEQK